MEFNVEAGAGPSKMPTALDKVPKPMGFNVETSANLFQMPMEFDKATTGLVPDTFTVGAGLPETLMESDVTTAAIPQDPLAHAPPSKLIEPPQLNKFNFTLTPQATKIQDGDSSRSPMPQLDLQRAKRQHRQDIRVSRMN